MRRILFVLLACFVPIQLTLIILRYTLVELNYALLVRLHTLITFLFLMVLASLFIWKNTSAAIDFVFVPNTSRKSSLCAADICRALLALFLLLTHSAFAFFYFFLGEEPHFLAFLSLVAVALYLHILIFMFAVFIIRAIVKVFRRVLGQRPSESRTALSERHVQYLLAIAVAIVFVIAGMIAAYIDPVIHRINVPIRDLPGSLHGFRIALLTDLHIGPTVGRTRTVRVVATTNALNPDLIAISGDLADGFVEQLKGAASPLAELKSKYGIYFATGNHEYLHGDVEQWFVYLRQSGVMPLHNEHVRLKIAPSAKDDSNRSSIICMAGVDDLYAQRAHLKNHKMDHRKALNGCLDGDIVILLAHQPNAAKIILDDSEYGSMVDVVLSGHTHAGQMYPFIPIVHLANAYTHGLYEHTPTKAHVVVSAGVNFFGPPVKMFGTCEVVEVTLTRQA